MAHYLAIEADRNELRIAAASLRAGQISVDHAAIVKLNLASDNDVAPAAEKLAAHLEKHGLQRSHTVLVFGRAGLELRLLTVPPVPVEDLPDIVRFQAIQQFTNMGDQWPLDFTPTEETPEGVRQVLAAAVTPELMNQGRALCSPSGIEPKGVILRACGTATLVRHQAELQDGEYVLVIELLDDSVDLTVLSQTTLHVARTVKLPHADDEAARRRTLLNEIRRTLASARTNLKGQPISRVFLLQDDDFHQSLLKDIETQTKLPGKILNPLAGLQLSGNIKTQRPEQIERLAPLLGVLMDELHQRQHAIDFLRPKRPPVPKNYRQQWTAVAALAATLVLVVFGTIWWSLHQRDNSIKLLKVQSANLDKLVKQAQERRKQVDSYQAWLASSPNWLTELNHLARRIPLADQVMLHDLTASRGGSTPGVQGTMSFKGSAYDQDIVSIMEEALRDPRYKVVQKNLFHAGDPRYGWVFEEQVALHVVEETEETTAPKPDEEAKADEQVKP
jgi:Tfp pilus assembly protein PilN/Tfp pilus assembly PilM family ATPase